MKELLTKADDLLNPLRKLASTVASPLLDLAFRLYVAQAFFKSGWLRLQSALNNDWGSQIFLFEMEHPVPGLAPGTAAAITTAGELILPVLVALGLFARFGAAGLFTMALVIQLTYIANMEHLLWMALMASIFIKGPGPISVDHFLVRWIQRDR